MQTQKDNRFFAHSPEEIIIFIFLAGRATALSAVTLWCAEQFFLLFPVWKAHRDSFGCRHLFIMQTCSADCHGRHPKPSDTLKDAVNSYPEKFGGKLQPQLQSLCFRLSVHGASHQHPLKQRANIISVIYLPMQKQYKTGQG